MKKVINVYKPIGATPLEMVKKLKNKYPEYKSKKIGYAGRLDPMAEGVLILLVEPETKKRKYYQKLSKTYEFEMLFGLATDTHDLLGLPNKTIQDGPDVDMVNSKLKIVLPNYKGGVTQTLPPYSSARVAGKPLFWWARNKRLGKIRLPKKKVLISKLNLKGITKLERQSLHNEIVRKIKKVEGDFRQNEILSAWEKVFTQSKTNNYILAKFSLHCSSGTYVRALVDTIGKDINIPATTFSIKRSSVGKYKIENSTFL